MGVASGTDGVVYVGTWASGVGAGVGEGEREREGEGEETLGLSSVMSCASRSVSDVSLVPEGSEPLKRSVREKTKSQTSNDVRREGGEEKEGGRGREEREKREEEKERERERETFLLTRAKHVIEEVQRRWSTWRQAKCSHWIVLSTIHVILFLQNWCPEGCLVLDQSKIVHWICPWRRNRQRRRNRYTL